MAFRTIGAEGGVRSRLMAALSYMGVMCLVPLIMNRQDRVCLTAYALCSGATNML